MAIVFLVLQNVKQRKVVPREACHDPRDVHMLCYVVLAWYGAKNKCVGPRVFDKASGVVLDHGCRRWWSTVTGTK
ncbi:hypothetical protein QL285_023312 [Trifolium repens]|jgi:hypothetical protein|nr:hypothetical protein QL285_023312 [Trifolium repens]